MSPDRVWRGFGTYLSFTVFGLVSLMWLVLYPALLVLPPVRRQRATRWLVRLWFQIFLRFMRALGICTWSLDGQSKLGRPGQLIVANRLENDAGQGAEPTTLNRGHELNPRGSVALVPGGPAFDPNSKHHCVALILEITCHANSPLAEG